MTELTGQEKAMFDALMAARKPMNELIPFLKACVYGDSGFGKTVFSMQLAQAITPPGKSIEYIDYLEGWVALLNHRDEGLLKNVHRESYEGISQIDTLGKFIKMGVEPFDNIGTVILDEFSSMTKSDLFTVVKSRAAKDSSKDPNVPTQPDFYAGTNRADLALTSLLQAKVNVIVVSHIREDKDKSGAVVTRPAFMPNFSDTFRQMMHLVAHLTAEEFIIEETGEADYKRSLQVHPTRRVNAKTRIGGLRPNVPPEVLIPAVVEWMHGNRESEPVDEKGNNLVVVKEEESVEDALIEVLD
jgi:hypothetical protein